MTSVQAVEKGFADEEEQTMQISACLRGRTAIINGLEMDWSQYAQCSRPSQRRKEVYRCFREGASRAGYAQTRKRQK
ncbi:hypothetical protein [Paenibacillus larvae]|uniref:hypothetical protein n=1 Tax=Paenibacillus larvae TaxID=1464 RepID=UPI00289381D8|nr:hypothetical protein [Paenibacillus larvae]